MNKIILIIAILAFTFHALAQEIIYKINKYHLSKLEIDSIENSISNSSFIEKIIKNGLTHKDLILLYNPSNQIYLLKILNSVEINNENKGQLLINKIVYDWSRSLTDSLQNNFNSKYNYYDYIRPIYKCDTINSKKEAINDYLNNHYKFLLNFSEVLFVINGIPIVSAHGDVNRKLGIIDQINLMIIDRITILNGRSATALYGSSASNGCILIEGKESKKNLFFLREKKLKQIKK